MKEYMKGKHRQHNWVKTTVRLSIGLVVYYWELPGMIKGIFTMGTTVGANTVTNEKVKKLSSEKRKEMFNKH